MNSSSNFTHNSQKSGQNAQYFSMKHINVHAHNGILLGYEEEYVTDINNIMKFKNMLSERLRPKKYILYYSIYIKF